MNQAGFLNEMKFVFPGFFLFVAYLTEGFKSLLLVNHVNLGGKDEPAIFTNTDHLKTTKKTPNYWYLHGVFCCLKLHPSGW